MQPLDWTMHLMLIQFGRNHVHVVCERPKAGGVIGIPAVWIRLPSSAAESPSPVAAVSSLDLLGGITGISVTDSVSSLGFTAQFTSIWPVSPGKQGSTSS